MTLETQPAVPRYIPASPTQEPLDYADLAVLDFAKVQTPEGRAELAATARDALHNIGFFYVVNHGLSPSETERIFDIADVPFSQVSDDEKQTYLGKMLETGSFQGYKPRQYWHINGGVKDQIETYNLNRDVWKKSHPNAMRPFLPELSGFAKHNHNVLHMILRLLALGLQIPEDTFVNQHRWDATGETYVRFMKYYPRTAEDEEKTQQVWLKGHTDIGSITVLWSQPVSALQILSPGGQWKWIRHIHNALVINAGDCMEFLSGGLYKATIHRVVQPPVDQRERTRLGVVYFAMPEDQVKLVPVSGSPVLEKIGAKRRFEDEKAPVVEAWRKYRTASYGKIALVKGDEEGVEEEYMNGIPIKHYN